MAKKIVFASAALAATAAFGVLPCRFLHEMTGEYGPDHDKTFESAALLNGKVIGRGKGKTKKEAEQEAAGDALRKLKNEA